MPIVVKRTNNITPLIYLFVLVLLCFFSGCSTKKNTWLSRNYQALNTDFNVYFNGNNSFNDGLKNIRNANKDDYSTIIPMYPVSNHSNTKAAVSDMDRTIEKCRKAIKLHSIKIKPKKNYSKANDPEYKLYYNQEEFNPSLKKAWILLAKSEFHKGDFLGSVGTFSYIVRHFNNDKNLIITCQLWMVRAYAEMNWIFEAEQILSTVVQDNLKSDNVPLFAAVNADMLLKKKNYKEAIPFLELALSKERDGYQRMRFTYILAQLYQKTGDERASYKMYEKVIKMNPPYEMEFNARISQAQLGAADVVKMRKELHKMLKSKNNKDYLDQIYFALGKSYLQHGDTLMALKNFRISADTSSRKGIEKAQTLITMGDIYYLKHRYISAQPCYDEASKLLNTDYEDFNRIAKRSETLGALVQQYEIVQLQDSLQNLSRMPESERMKVIEKHIEKLVADEKLAEQKIQDENRRHSMNPEDDLMNTPPIGANSGNWYFYNADIVRSGQAEFMKKWGRRKLEDNWRRTSKSSTLFGEDANPVAEKTQTAALNEGKISDNKVVNQVSDNKKPEFYIQQIPLTPSQLAKSNEMLSTALFAMAGVYKDKVEDYAMASDTYKAFIDRFPADKRVVDAYFNLYMIEISKGNTPESENYRLKIVKDFPDSKYYKALSDPNYASSLKRMNSEQDSVYENTYTAYNKSNYQKVFDNAALFRKSFPLSPLMPKMLLLNALSVGKKGDTEEFRKALEDLVKQYPASDVTPMAKDMLALTSQGQVNKPGSTGGSLLTLRDEKTLKADTVDVKRLAFSTDKIGRHRLLLISSNPLVWMDKLQYSIASYNFSRFVIKDFDFVINKLDTARNVLSVTNFDSYEEVVWYLKNLKEDATISKMMYDNHVQEIIVSDENFGLLRTKYRLEDYIAFQVGQKNQTTSTTSSTGVKPELVTKRNIGKSSVPGPNDKTVAMNTGQKVKTMNQTNTDVLSVKQNEKVQEISSIKGQQLAADINTNSKTPDKLPESKDATSITNVRKQELTGSSVVAKGADTKVSVTPSGAVAAPPVSKTLPAVVQQPKQDDVPLYKGLFGYRANEPHFVAFYVLNGNVDFARLKTAFDTYNKLNYPQESLTLSIEKPDNKSQIIILGSFKDATSAKNYLLKIVKEPKLFEGLKGTNYRNLLGSQRNLNVMVQQNALNTYFEFMQQYYLK